MEEAMSPPPRTRGNQINRPIRPHHRKQRYRLKNGEHGTYINGAVDYLTVLLCLSCKRKSRTNKEKKQSDEMGRLSKRSLCKSPAIPEAVKQPEEMRRRKVVGKKRRRRSSRLQVREARAMLSRMVAEVAEQRAQLAQMREEAAEAVAAVEEMETEIARMRGQNRARALCALEAEFIVDSQ